MKVHKTWQKKRENYTYVSATGEKTVLKPGENGVTEEMIRELHRADDREVENNLKNMHVPRTKKKKEEIKKWETEHPGEEYPREWNVSIEAFVSDDDDDSTADRDPALIDHKASEFYEPYSSAAAERLWEIIHELPPRQRKALRLTWFIGYSQAETAAIMHCSKANICKLNKSAFERIRTDEKLVGILFRRG